MVPPNGNTTFNVVFLPREQGAISTSLNIHTSFGKLRLLVRGVGLECPYRLKPLVGIRAPLNATIMPEIHMYNPHQKALQILEVYSSGGQFQLELPSGDPEAPKDLWEIPPLTTKPVIRIRFHGYAAGNYSAYIRIKISETLNSSDAAHTGVEGEEEQVLVIPVEFEILPQYGLYAVNPLLEFGHIAVDTDVGSPVKVLKQNLFLRHSKSQLEVNDLELKSFTDISGVLIEGCNVVVLQPNEVKATVVRLNDKLELELQDKKAHTYHSVELIIRADIFKGNLHYDVNKTLFLIPTSNKLPDGNVVCSDDNGRRLLTVRNNFQIPMAIYDVKTKHNDTNKLSLQLKSFETGMVLEPGLSLDLLVASSLCKIQQQHQQQKEQDLKDLKNYKTAIYVYTNITKFEIPIVISSARLFVSTQTKSIWRFNTSVYTKELDLGSVPIRETSNKGFIILQNRNSIPIKLDIDFQRPQGIYYHILFLGCIRAADLNETNSYKIDLEKANYKFSSLLKEGDMAVYIINLQPYTTENNWAYLKILTQYENITINIKFTTALGRLEVDQEKLHFANCFPGKLCSSELSIRSTFKQPLHIKYINFTDSGLRFEDKNPLGSKIAPQSVTNVGRIYFQPSALCGSRCYIQQTDESATFPSSFIFDNLNIPNFDNIELRRRTELYRHFKYYFQNMNFTMTTKEMQYFELNLMIELEWPQLVNGRQILPTIEINKTHVHEVKISNPSDNPILIDYSLSDPTWAKQTHITLPLEVVVIAPSCYLTDKAVFSLVNVPPKKPILIPGLSSITIPIKFQADYLGTICTLLSIRNNLTLYEGVWISTKTVQSQFRLGNRKPGSQTPLLFEITEQHLSTACPARDEKIGKSGLADQLVQPQVMLRRVFTARNSGELPIRIDGFLIGDQPCQAYGFQVIDCSSFELMANSSKKIEISFQSDFTVTRITRPLMLKTNLTYDVSYTLVAQLPSKGLEQCEFLLIRPPWEEKIRNAAIVMLLITFVLVLLAVHIDYGNIMYHQSVLYEARDKGTVHPTFNLRNIAMRSTQNINEQMSTVETNHKNKMKISSSEKNDNSTSILSLRKRSVKNSKLLNGDPKSSSTSTRSGMTLADMVSWTFGTKPTKRSATNNINKNSKPADATTSELKAKSKFNEKSLIDKMDGDMKKFQISKKSKVFDKVQLKNLDKNEMEEVKLRRDDNFDKESRKEKNSPKLQTKATAATNSSSEGSTSSKESREHRKSLELSSANSGNTPASTDRNQNSPKEAANGRKIGKTPGRERRKQTGQNNSPAISDITSSSCSSSTSSSCSSNHNATSKRNERKTKVKASNSLKFITQNSSTTNLFPTSSSSSSPTSMAAHISKSESSNSHVDILTPWDCGNHATFSDVLQKSQQPRSTTSTDLMQQGSLFDLMNHSPNGLENSEIKAALTPKRSKNPATDLGPIGSRKSPSSTPVWEPIQSAITIQLPRPSNTTSTANMSTASSSHYYAMNSNFGYNELASLSSPTLQQQQQDIHAQLLILQRQLLEQQQLQQQQFLNSNVLNSNWSNLSSPLWSPILGNGSTDNGNSTSSIFSQPQTQNSTWSLTPNSSSPASGLVRPPPGLEQNFPINNNLATTLSSDSVTSSAVSSAPLASTFNTTMAASENTDNDNMPMFNLFGGLSSIWNDNWKESTNQQQQQQPPQNPQ